MWSKIFESAVYVLHWLTGWLVHPKSGGCHEMDAKNLKDKLSETVEKK